MPRTRLVLLLACLVASACQATPAPQAPSASTVGVSQSGASRAATPRQAPARPAPKLAHDGGIVYMAPLDAIADPAKKTLAATLGTELAVGLRAERTMRDAELIAGGSLIGLDGATFRLLGEEDDEEDGGEAIPEPGESDEPTQTPRPSASPSSGSGEADDGQDEDDDARGTPAPDGTPDVDDDDDDDDDHDAEEEKAEEAAKEAWKQLSSEERNLIEKRLEGREAKVLAKLAAKLERKKKAYAKQGADAVVSGADGGKDVTSSFTLGNAARTRKVTVVRKFDATGTLVQSVQTLGGTADGVAFSAERSRTINPDGSIGIVSDTRITLDGQARTIHWEKTIAPDGTLSATGTLTRADGTVVKLSSSGTEDGTETIAGQDAGVTIKLTADVAAGSATATVEAGEAGSATVKLDADDEDDDEGDVDDDEDDEDEVDDERDDEGE